MADDFLSTYTPLANDVATATGVDPSVVLGVIDTETGGGAHVKGNNIFGISPSGPQGQFVASYPDVQTAAQAFVTLMQTPRYRGVAAAGDPASQAAALVRGGYNTANPQYAQIVASKALNFGKQLGYQDSDSGGGGGTTQTAAAAPPDYSDTIASIAAKKAQQPGGGAAADPTKDAVQQELAPPPVTAGQPAGAQADPTKAQVSSELGNPPPPKPTTPVGVGTGSGRASEGPPEADAPSWMMKSAPPQFDANLLPIFPKPQPAGTPILDAARAGAQGAPDASGWAPGGLQLGRYIVNPLLEAGGALFRGGQEAVSQVVGQINPQLGRDIAAMPEAFPTGGEHPLEPPTAGAARNALKRPVTMDDLRAAIGRADQAAAADRPAPAASGLNPDQAAREAAQPQQGVPPAAATATQPGTTFLDNSWLRQAGDTGQGYDMTKGGTAMSSAAQQALDAGGKVQLVADGGAKTVDITRVANGTMYDAKNQPWGSASIAFDGTGREGLRITPRSGEAPEERSTPSSEPITEEDRVAAGEAPQPQSAGAAASRQGTPGGDLPDQSNLELARNLRKDIDQSARDRAGPDLKDDTAYVTDVPGGTLPARMTPERDFNPQTALDHKRRYESSDGQAYRTTYDANSTQRNQGMEDLLRQDAGDGLTLDQARQTRRSAAPDTFGAFDGERPVDASGEVSNIQKILAGPEGKRQAVERTMNNVLTQMYDQNGELETMPSQLYGVKQHVDDLLSKAQRPLDREGNDAAASQGILKNVKDRLDSLIQSGAPKYGDYRQAYRQLSQPVNQQRFLQRYWEGTKKLTNDAGDLQLKKVNGMLEDVHKGLQDTKFNLAKSLTDQQIRNIVNVRNELAAKQLTDIQGRVRGSDSYQKINAAAEAGQGALGRAIKGGLEMGTHGALGYLATHGVPQVSAINALMAYDRMVMRPARMERRAARQQATARAAANALDVRLLSKEPVNPLGMY